MSPEQLWTLPQTLVRLRTGSDAVAEALPESRSAHTLKVEILKSMPGKRQLPTRIRSDLVVNLRFENVRAERYQGDHDLWSLLDAVHTGQVSCLAYDVRKGVVVIIPGCERHDLTFQIHPDNPSTPFGFWSLNTGNCRFVEPRFFRNEIGRWADPPPATPIKPADAVEDRIFEFLMEITAHGPIRRDDAFEKCLELRYRYNAIKRAWNRLPRGKKLRRGQHGPHKH